MSEVYEDQGGGETLLWEIKQGGKGKGKVVRNMKTKGKGVRQ